MATVALEYVGGAIGGYLGGPWGAQVGAAVGGAIGAYIDGAIIQSLTAPDPPHLEELNVTVSTYGKPIPLLFGEEVRIAGNVIWSSDLIERDVGGKGGPPTSFACSVNVAIALGDGTCERVKKIWANGKVIYDEDRVAVPPLPPLPATDILQGYYIDKTSERMSVFGSMQFHPGSAVQDPDPAIEAELGVGNVPRYKKTCYVVLNELQLADFGNRLPNLEFLVQAVTGESVGGAARRIVAKCGIEPNSVSTSLLQIPLRGYVVGNKANGTGCLMPLAIAYSFDLSEVWGSLRLQPRGTSVMGFIPAADLGARDSGNEREEPIRWPRAAETNLPQQASISFSDPARDYQVSAQSARRESGTSDANVMREIAVVLTVDEGKPLADKMLWEAWTARQIASASVSDRWLSIEPGRSYLIENRLGRDRVKVVRKTRGANGAHRLDLRRERPEIYQSTAPGAAAPTPANTVSIPGETQWQPLDIPILREVDDDSGFYSAVTGASPGWRGMDLFRATDDVAFEAINRTGRETVMANVSGTVPDGPTHIWDMATIITVTCDASDDELTSATDLETLAGANTCWIGPASGADGEILAFMNADLVAPGVYELSGLLRGRFGTEYAAPAHGAAERFVLLKTQGMLRNDFGSADWNRERFYKPVSLLQDIADVTSIPFTNTGEGKRPYSPVGLEGDRDGSDNLTIDWVRRTRIPFGGLGSSAPLGEAVEAYEVDILDGAAVVRTISASTPVVTYSAAEQTTDGLTPGDPVDGIVYQISDIRGRGRGQAFTVAS